MSKSTIIAESGEGDPHDLRSLATKVVASQVPGGRSWPDGGDHAIYLEGSPELFTRPSEPLQPEVVWGMICLYLLYLQFA